MAEIARSLNLARLLNTVGNLNGEDLEKLLSSLKPNPVFRIPLDFALEGFYEVLHLSFDFSKDEYVLREKKKTEEGKEVVSIAPGCWLSLETKTRILTSTRPGKTRTLEGIKAFKYLGSDQILVLKEEHEILDTDLRTISSTVPKGVEVSFPCSFSDKYIAFRNPHQKRLIIFDRSFKKVGISYRSKNIVAHCLLDNGSEGTTLVVIQKKEDYESGIASLWVTNLDSPGRVLMLGGLREGPYLLSPIGSQHFAFSDVTEKVVIHKVTIENLRVDGVEVLEVKQILGKEEDVTCLGEDVFITGAGTLYRRPPIESANFIVNDAFGAGWNIKAVYPSLASLREVGKLLEIPVVLDVVDIIVGFCVESAVY